MLLTYGVREVKTMQCTMDLTPSAGAVKQLTAQEKRTHAMCGTPADRASFALGLTVNVKGFVQATSFMESLLERARRTKCPGGLWILGLGGCGKTFALSSFVDKHPHVDNGDTRVCEVLRLPFDGRPSESDILLAILLLLGQDPSALKHHRNADLNRMVRSAIEQCKVKMILFDEAQHIWLKTSSSTKRSGDRLGGHLGDFLKRLYDETGVAFVFAGTPGLTALLEQDTQASTRWPGMKHLEQFRYDENFLQLLDILDAALPMESPAGLSEARLSKQLFEGSQGNFRRLKQFLAEAVFVAATERSRTVQRRHFALAHFKIFCDENTPYGPAQESRRFGPQTQDDREALQLEVMPRE